MSNHIESAESTYTHYHHNLTTLTNALPSWLLNAAHSTRQAYADSVEQRRHKCAAASTILAKLIPLEEFSERLLGSALRQRFKAAIDVQSTQFTHYIVAFKAPTVASLPAAKKPVFLRQSSLLQAALQNFTASEALPKNIAADSELLQGQTPVTQISAYAFIALCRELNIGQRYQQHLASVFDLDLPPQHWQGSVSTSVAKVLAEGQCSTLKVAAHIAYMKAELSTSAYSLLLSACSDQAPSTPTVMCSQVLLFGHPLSGVLTFRAAHPGTDSQPAVEQCVLYVPGNANELYEVPNRLALTAHLSRQLLQPAFKEAIVHQAPLFERADLAGKLAMGIKQTDIVERPVNAPIFEALLRQQCQQRHADSLLLAVPTALRDSLEQQEREQRLQNLENTGMSLLSIAALFVPVINMALLAYNLYDITKEVYHGAEDWAQGNRDEAIKHLTGVICTVGKGLLIGAVGSAVSQMVKSSSFFNSLRPITLDNGSSVLWSPNLQPYRESISLIAERPQQNGVITRSGRNYIAMDDHTYRVTRDSAIDRWRIVHPRRTASYSPILEHNGQGAWRHQMEQPWHWPSISYIFRRLGPMAHGLDETDITRVLRWAAVDESQLCQIHAENMPAPALLKLACDHCLLARRIGRFLENLSAATITDSKIAAFLLSRLPGWNADTAAIQVTTADNLRTLLTNLLNSQNLHALGITRERLDAESWTTLCARLASEAHSHRAALFDYCDEANQAISLSTVPLRRAFPGLPVRLAEALLLAANEEELRLIHRRARIPLRLAEQARWALKDYRVMCVLQGFEWPWRRDQAFERLTLGLLTLLPNWPGDVRIELRADSQQGAALAVTQGHGEATVGILVKLKQGGYLRGESTTAEQDLFAALLPLLPSGTRPESVQQLNRLLADAAHANRAQAARLMGHAPLPGNFNPPQRLTNNRLGYPMSGRGSMHGISMFVMEQLKALYPQLTDAELTAHLAGLRTAGLDVAQVLAEKAKALESLRGTLEKWVTIDGPMKFSEHWQRRRRVADEFIKAWRMQASRILDGAGDTQGYRLLLNGTPLGGLPEFPADVCFEHIQHLSLNNASLGSLPYKFLKAFPNLRTLELEHNRLRTLPPIITQLNHLRVLLCADNNISWTGGSQVLSGLRWLERLDLDNNPLASPPDLSMAIGMRELRLRNTQLNELPAGLTRMTHLETADFRDNYVTALPVELFEPTSTINRALFLQGNPLSMETRAQIRLLRRRGINLGNLTTDNELGAERYWLDTNDSATSVEREAQWDDLQEEPGSDEFFRLLRELAGTADFSTARNELSHRVWSMIGAAAQNTALRTELFELAGTPTTCGDSVALSFSLLEIQVEVFKARELGGQTHTRGRLLWLARGLFRLEQLDRLVLEEMEYMPQLPGQTVDEVEVSLAYRIGLAQELALPGQPSSMLYSSLAHVDPEMLADAKTKVIAAETPEALQDFLVHQPFWCTYLREAHAGDFDQVRQSLTAGEERLESQRTTINDQQYLDSYAGLQQTYLHKTDALLRRLSEAAVREALSTP